MGMAVERAREGAKALGAKALAVLATPRRRKLRIFIVRTGRGKEEGVLEVGLGVGEKIPDSDKIYGRITRYKRFLEKSKRK